MFCWIISLVLVLEFAPFVISGNRGHGGGHGWGGRGQGHGWGGGGGHNHHGNGWRQGQGWGGRGNGNYPYFNGGGNSGIWVPPTQILPPNQFSLSEGQLPATPQTPNISYCPRPSFTDDIPQLIIEKCETHSDHRSCWDSSVGIPIGWTVLMTCVKKNIRLKQPSTCSTNGEWTTKFPSNCEPLFAKYAAISHLESLQKIPLAVTHSPSPSTTEGVVGPPSEDNIIFLPTIKNYEKSCPMLKMQLSDNFTFSCFLRHQSSLETVGCIRTHVKVPSGTIALLKCKPPFYNRDGNYSQWTCDDGSWNGDFDGKLKCVYSKIPLPVRHRPRPVTMITTTHPLPMSTLSTSRSSPSPYGWVIPGSNTPPTPDRTEVIRSTTVMTPLTLTSTSTSTTTATTSRRPLIKLTTATPTPAIIKTSTNAAKESVADPASDYSYEYDYDYNANDDDKEVNQTTQAPLRSTSPTPALTPDKDMCSPLKPRSEGMVLECVSKTKATPTKAEQIFVNGCDIPQPVGAEAKYSCRQYYESSGGLGSIYRKCKEDRTWSGSSESFSCIPQCGGKNEVFVPLITSGTPAFKGEWPWHAALFQRDANTKASSSWEYICGGTLISKKTVITAAHCVTFQDSSTLRNSSIFRLDLGRFQLDRVDDVVQTMEVASIHIHPSYSPFGYDSDIAIVILKEAVNIGYFVRPICFPQSLNTAQEELMLDEGSLGTVAGWGKTETEKLSNVLHTAELRVVSQKNCSAGTRGVGGGRLQIKSTTYCAAPNRKNGTELDTAFINVCNGDSGGGMYFPQTTSDSAQIRWYLQGVVSVGIGNEDNKCQPNQFSFFTRVGRYADWLTRAMSENDAL